MGGGGGFKPKKTLCGRGMAILLEKHNRSTAYGRCFLFNAVFSERLYKLSEKVIQFNSAGK